MMKQPSRFGFQRVAGWSALAALACVVIQPAIHAQLVIERIEFRADGRLALNFPRDPASYYRLLLGTRVDAINQVAALSLTPPLISPLSGGDAAFFRVQQVPRVASLDTDADGIPDAYELQHPPLDGLNPADARLDLDGNGRTELDDYLATLAPPRPTTIAGTSPMPGEGGVSVNREVVVYFSEPLAADAMVSTANFSAGFGGRKFLSRVELSSDRRKASLFYLEPVPGSTRVTVEFNGSAVPGADGRPLDADGDGQPGGVFRMQYDTYSTTPVAGTAISGVVYASEPVPPRADGSTNLPLPGVTITVDGAEETLRAVTDAAGRFTLTNCPAGRFFVHVDGRTSPLSQWPSGAYYPYLGKAWEAVGGRADNLVPGGVIYLPLVAAGTLQPVSATADTVVTFPPATLAAFPELAGVAVTVPANALFSDEGVRGGRVGIAPVPADRLPEPLPPGVEMPLVITIQTDGPSNFDRPVPVRFPNLPLPSTGQRLPPGASSALLSFDHDKGRWEIMGTGTVTPDGLFIETDPGVGVRQPGWHGFTPVASAGGGPIGGGCGSGGAPAPSRRCGQNPAPPPTNGCGPQNLPQGLFDLVNANNPNLAECASFKAACDAHDVGYYTCGRSKKDVDDQFLEDLLAACNCTSSELFRADCIANALHYYTLVSIAGDSAYADGQSEGCLCEDPPPSDCGGASGGGGPNGPFPQGGPLPASARRQIALAAVGMAADPPSPRGTPRPPGTVVFQRVPHRFAVLDHETGTIVQRGRTGSDGYAVTQLLLLPGRTYSLLLVQETTLYDGWVEFTTGPVGSVVSLPPIFVRPPYAFDQDFDRLSDQGELVIGTDMFNPDSDGDGVRDGAEILGGSNPLDNAPLTTGVIASADTPGTAHDVDVANDLVVVADGERGLAVFRVGDGINPVWVAQVDTPGDARAVALSGNLVAVADGEMGLAILDISTPALARVTHQVNLGSAARAVATAGPLAYAGTQAGELFVVDMVSGQILERVSLGRRIDDLRLGGDYLYVAMDTELRSFDPASGAWEALATVSLSFFPESVVGRRRLFVGSTHAYVTSYPGYDVVDIRDPRALARVGQARDVAPNSFKQIVDNGSGLGVAAVGPVPRGATGHDVWLYRATDPTVTTNVLAIFATPGIARALALYNGLAYVADSANGLQVVNYMAADALGVPPTIALNTSFPLNPAQVEEGKLVRFTALVADDAQVRSVEFYVDGVRVATDGNFPFEYRFVTPVRSATKAGFTLRARAYDTGGNFTDTAEVTVALVADATPPRVLRVVPGANALLPELSSVLVFLSEVIAPESVTEASVQLLAAGADGQPGTADDVPLADLRREAQAQLPGLAVTTARPLPPGRYRLRLAPPLADLAGNPLAAPFTVDLTVYDGAVDTDGDGVPDDVERLLGTDPARADTNGNGVPDGLEDPDGDGLGTAFEIAHGLDPRLRDTDGNRVHDGDEDFDNDFVTNRVEFQRGLNPRRADTDGDGWLDEAELTGESDPRDAASTPRLFSMAQPTSQLTLPLATQLDPSNLGLTLARPSVQLLLPTAPQLDPTDMGLTLARPTVQVALPAVSTAAPEEWGPTIARPVVRLRPQP